jgi:hypothetical protein
MPKSSAKSPTQWISTDEAVDLSGYDCAYLRRLIQRGKIEAAKKGGQWWVDCDGLQAFLRGIAQLNDGWLGGRAASSESGRPANPKGRASNKTNTLCYRLHYDIDGMSDFEITSL